MFKLLKRKKSKDDGFPGLDAYEKLGVISEGTRSILYRARRAEEKKIYCLKILKENAAETIDKMRRIGLKWEGEWSLELKHPNIVETHHAGREGDTYYLLLDYLGGSSLLHCIHFEPRRLEGWRLEVARTVTEAIDFLHENQVIHRDICPKNFMFDEDDELKLIDFGVALSTAKKTLKRAGVTGTPSYLAPEIFSSRQYDVRTDIYALGVTLFEIFTGAKPFKVSAEDVQSAIVRHLQLEAPSPKSLNPAIPNELDNLILRTLAKEPSQRMDSTAGILLVLDNLLNDPTVKL